MFSDMRSEVRNLLLVASELGGQAAQYVRVLREEKERLLPIDTVQAEMGELKAERDRAQAAEEASMLRALKMANNNTYEAREKAEELKGKLEQAEKQIATLQKTNDESFVQLARQAEALELMQSNRVHAEVYQRVAAERDRAMDELRAKERSYLKEVSTLNKAITKLEESLAQREQYDEEARQSLITQRNDAVVAAGKAQAKLLSIEALVGRPMSDIHMVAFKAAGKAQCSHDKTQVVADSVASFIRSPIRGVLES